MNEIVNKFLLTGKKIMPDLLLRQPGFTYNACGPFKETGDLNYVYKNELDKVSFAHDAAYTDSKYLAKGMSSDKVL